jgi:hypothetical protein
MLPPSAPPAWAKSYRGSAQDTVSTIQPTADGGYILGGTTASWGAGMNDLWMMKLAADGAVEWQKAYGGSASDTLSSIRQTSDGGYIVAASTDSFGAGNTDAWVLKLSSTGGITWQFAFGGAAYDCANDARQTSDGGYIVCGATESFGAGSRDAWVLKLDTNGTILWQKTYGTAAFEQVFQVWELPGGGYALGGELSPAPGNAYNAWLLKLASDGTIASQKSYGGITADYTTTLFPTSDGGFLLAGNLDIGIGVLTAGVYKIDSLGALSWARAFYDLTYPSFGQSIIESASGQYMFLGTAYQVGQGYQCWLANLNTDGSTAWQKVYGLSAADFGISIAETPDGGFVVASNTMSFGPGDYDAWVLKTLPSGDLAPLSSTFNLAVNPLTGSTVNTPSAASATSAATVTVTAATVTDTMATVAQQVP